MKLELDINSAPNSSPENLSGTPDTSDTHAEKVKRALRSGINLAKEGKRAEARQQLLTVTEAEPENETAWLWLASISEYPEELLVFLQNVLKVNPENERALEWSRQTKTLLSKTFVQRGINASHDNQKEFAKQCFLQGIVHDDENEMAWLWLASTSDSPEEKLAHLQKVLQINPQNETALSSLSSVKNQISNSLLKKANSAAISGDRDGSKQMLETIMKYTPNLEEAWILKAYLAEEYYEKINSYQRVLDINPENEPALAGLASLRALSQKASKTAPQNEQPLEMESSDAEQSVSEDNLGEAAERSEERFEAPANEMIPDVSSDEIEQPHELLARSEEPRSDEVTETASDEDAGYEFRKDADQGLEFRAAGDFVHSENQVEFEELRDEEGQDVRAQQTRADVEGAVPEREEVEDSPTQELDEEFARTADAVFGSYEQSEVSRVEDAPTEAFDLDFKSQELQTENTVVEEYVFDQNEVDETDGSPADAEETRSESAGEYQADATEYGQTEALDEPSPNVQPAPEYSDHGFEYVSNSPFFADEREPTVELSSSEVSEVSAPTNEYFEHQKNLEAVSESTDSAGLSEPQPEQYPDAAAADLLSETELEQKVEEFEEAPAVVTSEENTAEANTVVQPQMITCPFCDFENEPQEIICRSCQAMTSLSDLEMLLAHQNADQDLLLASIERMEVERTLYEFGADEFTSLGLAYLNARNLRKGLTCLKEATSMNPNDVVLASKVNFLAIRLNEIEEHDQKVHENQVKSRTILVVDDSPTVRKLISGKLEKSGHSVVAAVDGMDALAKINEVIPDLILLDITMPRLDGYQVCKLIRNNPVTKDIPIVMISGKDGFFDKVRGRMAGSSGYITKPFGPDTLMKTIESYLN